MASTTLVTNLNADRLDGLDSTAFLQSIPVPLTLSGTSVAHIIRGENTSTAGGASAISGVASAGTGNTSGVYGESNSVVGKGVYGLTTASAGTNYGVFGENHSSAGYGVIGFNTATSGINYGVHGTTFSSIGHGVHGRAASGSGINYGVYGETNSGSGRGVYGLANALSGTTYGGRFESESPSGTGVFGLANAASGTTYGVFGQSESTGGVAVRAYNPGLSLQTELAGPAGGVWTDGHVYRQYTANARSACIPIAYGSVAANGTISGGTGNFTVAHTVTGEYDITITGESYSNSTFAVSITALQNSTPFCGTAADAGTPLRVNMWNVLSGVKADVAFQFTVYTPNPANP